MDRLAKNDQVCSACGTKSDLRKAACSEFHVICRDCTLVLIESGIYDLKKLGEERLRREGAQEFPFDQDGRR